MDSTMQSQNNRNNDVTNITSNEVTNKVTTESNITNNEYTDLLDIIEKNNISPSLKEKMDKHSQLVNQAYTIFKSVYSTAMKQTVVSSIINGEIIETKPDNIFVDQNIKFDDSTFEKKCEFCSKTLYNYQKNAIKKIRELELRGYNINSHTGEKIVSNGWLLSLPIGSGKSLVFQFIALFYRDIPCHPIIISTDGQHIPDHDQMQWKYYPYYFENCGYIESKSNAVVALTNYQQRICTVILTHMHLLEQMQTYFEQDFPTIMKVQPNTRPRVRVAYPMDVNLININEYDIIVVPATQQNIDKLVRDSWELPFLRVIIDDYTSMPNIDSFRQILATSTIFVSGSGFDRKYEDIPASYYTLKFMPVSQMSLVGKPEETLEGIFRDSIATMELMGSHCEFSQYEFVTMCDEMVKQKFNSLPTNVYPILRSEPLIHNYMSLMFILKYYDRIKSAIFAVEKDLALNKLSNERVSYYLQWKEMLADTKTNPPTTERKKMKDGTIKITFTQPSMNPLYLSIYCDPRIGNQIGSSLVQQNCMVCAKKITDHNGYGMIACCCGAFYCSNCLKSMCTHYICNKNTGEQIYDKENYYCGCCRSTNPKYYFNINKKKDTNVYSYNLINDFFDTTELQNHTMFDYYFYMFLNGFKPLYQEGPALNIQNDIEQQNIPANIFKLKTIPTLERILPKDQLGILALGTINRTLHDLQILPKQNAIILFYGCPKYMINRVRNYYAEIIKQNNPQTALQIVRPNGKKETIQPISVLNLDFKDSVASLIGLHKNIVAIIQWQTPDRQDEINQLVGRILRLSSFGNKLYFYIVTNSIGFE